VPPQLASWEAVSACSWIGESTRTWLANQLAHASARKLAICAPVKFPTLVVETRLHAAGLRLANWLADKAPNCVVLR